MSLRFLVVFLVLVLGGCWSEADDRITWIDVGRKGNWSDETSWNTMRVPSMQDAVRIRSGFVYIDRDHAVTSLEVAGEQDKPVHLEVPSAGKLLVDGSLRFENVNLVIDGTVEVTGDVDIGTGTEISGNGLFVVHGKFDTGDLLKLFNSGVQIKVQPGRLLWAQRLWFGHAAHLII